MGESWDINGTLMDRPSGNLLLLQFAIELLSHFMIDLAKTNGDVPFRKLFVYQRVVIIRNEYDQ